jgi:hypothetical protein
MGAERWLDLHLDIAQMEVKHLCNLWSRWGQRLLGKNDLQLGQSIRVGISLIHTRISNSSSGSGGGGGGGSSSSISWENMMKVCRWRHVILRFACDVSKGIRTRCSVRDALFAGSGRPFRMIKQQQKCCRPAPTAPATALQALKLPSGL